VCVCVLRAIELMQAAVIHMYFSLRRG
jgi:hypothetical protein